MNVISTKPYCCDTKLFATQEINLVAFFYKILRPWNQHTFQIALFIGIIAYLVAVNEVKAFVSFFVSLSYIEDYIFDSVCLYDSILNILQRFVKFILLVSDRFSVFAKLLLSL